MTKVELIQTIADDITQLDVFRSQFPLGTGARTQLDNVRDQLDAQLKQLIRTAFAENTAAWTTASTRVSDINADLKTTIDDLNRVVETLSSFVALAGALDGLLKTVAPLL